MRKSIVVLIVAVLAVAAGAVVLSLSAPVLDEEVEYRLTSLYYRDRFGSLMVVGVMTLVGLQTFLNIGVVTGLLPTTGISLPFFSYGGTALSIQLAEMGIVLSVSRQMKPTKAG